MFNVNADRFDLVITDQTMPNLTGKELIAEVKKIRPDIPTILCTGYGTLIDEDKVRELGISFKNRNFNFDAVILYAPNICHN